MNIEGRLSQQGRPRADVAQTAERLICNQQVAGSTPAVGSRRGTAEARNPRNAKRACAEMPHALRSAARGSSSVGRASAFQAERRGFDSRLPLSRNQSTSMRRGERAPDRRAHSEERRKRTLLGTLRSDERARVEMGRDRRGAFAQVAQSAEHVLGKDEVGGSIPLLGLLKDEARPCVERHGGAGEERYPSGQREQTVNLPAYAFGGSNPPLSIFCVAADAGGSATGVGTSR